ncbi:MAG: hypothetical protein WB497_19960, partial [Pseudolabrys sp.]
LHTGQRRSDVVTMGRQHIRDGYLQIRQQKTGVELAIPVHPALQAIIAERQSHVPDDTIREAIHVKRIWQLVSSSV